MFCASSKAVVVAGVTECDGPGGMKSSVSHERIQEPSAGNRMKNLLKNPLRRARSTDSGLDAAGCPVFGVPLVELVTAEGDDIPKVVRKVVEHIEENGLDEEGLYRISGGARTIERLKHSFNSVGDADFSGVDIPSVAGLLKLFFRELPSSLVPPDMVDELVDLQKRYPGEAPPEVLPLIGDVLGQLPTMNYSVLKYLVLHLAKVAEHTATNKMTAVSLSIVFGPGIFQCGGGLEGLRQQGYANPVLCRLIQNSKALFGVEPPGEEGRSEVRKRPSKPEPYSEYIKRAKPSSPPFSPSEEASFSERSVDEAIEHSISSPQLHLSEDPLSPPSPSSPPPLPPSPSLTSPLSPLTTTRREGGGDVEREEEEEDGGRTKVFQRRLAVKKRNFRPRSFSPEDPPSPRRGHLAADSHSPPPPKSVSSHEVESAPGEASPVAKEPAKHAREEDMLRVPSPFSLHTSPNGTPSTSPSLTPRSSKVVSMVIEDSVKKYLFGPAPPQQPHSSTSSSAHGDNEKAQTDVYSLLLPNQVDSPPQERKRIRPADSYPKSHDSHMTHDTTASEDNQPTVIMDHSPKRAERDGEREKKVRERRKHQKKLRREGESGMELGRQEEHSEGHRQGDRGGNEEREMEAEISAPPSSSSPIAGFAPSGVVQLRQRKQPSSPRAGRKGGEGEGRRGGKGRRSVMVVESEGGGSVTSDGGGELGDLRVQVLSVSPESQDRRSEVTEGVVESRSGRVADLVQQFDEPDGGKLPTPPMEKPRKRKPKRKEFEMFEKAGITIGMQPKPLSPPPASHTSPQNTPHTTTPSPVTHHTTPTHTTTTVASNPPRTRERGREREGETEREKERQRQQQMKRGGGGGRGGDVVAIKNAPMSSSVSQPDGEGGGVTSDHTHTLRHLTKSRPKGPANRRLPTSHSGDNIATSPVREEGGRREEREEEHKRAVGRKEEGVRKEGRGKEGRRKEGEGWKERGVREEEREVTPVMSSGKKDPKEQRRGESPSNSSSPRVQTKHKTKHAGHTHKTTPLSHSFPKVAPEHSHKAVQGWQDGGEDEGGGIGEFATHPTPVSHTLPTLTNEELTHRIHELKQEVREFEASFVEKHNRKPSSSEKEPIRTQVEELTHLRRQRQLAREQAVMEMADTAERERLNITAPVAGKLENLSPPPPTDRLTPSVAERQATGKEDREKRTRSERRETPTARGSEPQQDIRREVSTRKREEDLGKTFAHPTLSHVTPAAAIVTVKPAHQPPVQETAVSPPPTAGAPRQMEKVSQKLMANLSEKRKKAGRPEELADMTPSQVMDEKHAVQRVLLHYEKVYGRPHTPADKEDMRPLYDRYREVKKYISSGEYKKPRATLPEVHSTEQRPMAAVVASGEDTLPSITLLHSALAQSLPLDPRPPPSTGSQLSHSALELQPSHVATVRVEGEREGVRDSSAEERRTVQEATLTDLYQLQEAALTEKKRIRRVLKEFENQFTALHNRAVTKEDRQPCQNEYDQYKAVKEQLSLIANEINKRTQLQNTM